MIETGFYFLDNGSIGEIHGFRKIKISEQEKQHLLDSNTRERMSGFNPPSGLSPSEYSNMFVSEFLKARNETNKDQPVVPFSVSVQVGNSESLSELHIIENNELFSHWQDSDLVLRFKEISKKYLSE